MTMTIPTIHLGGTSQQALLAQQVAAADALRTAVQALTDAGPHERDHLHPETYQAAKDEHQKRIMAVTKVLAEVEQLAQAIADYSHRVV